MTYVDGLLSSLTRVRNARSLRASSWDITGRNNDAWNVEPGETRVIADLQGPRLYQSYLDDAAKRVSKRTDPNVLGR